MIGKIIAGSSFAGTVGYVMKELSRILDAEGVNPPEVKNIIEDFKDQTRLNPRLKNTVGHISLSFSPKEAPHMTDALMTQIAKEYMQKMGITDTQYLHIFFGDLRHQRPILTAIWSITGSGTRGRLYRTRILKYAIRKSAGN